MTLAQMISHVIHRDKLSLTLEDILARARSKGHSDNDIYSAIAQLHKDKSITVTQKDGTNVYQTRVLKKVIPLSELELHEHKEWQKHKAHIRAQYEREQEALRASDPIEYARVEDIMARVGEFVWLEARRKKWLIPAGTEEHYNKLIYAKMGTKAV